jgi:hypothetical protein
VKKSIIGLIAFRNQLINLVSVKETATPFSNIKTYPVHKVTVIELQDVQPPPAGVLL